MSAFKKNYWLLIAVILAVAFLGSFYAHKLRASKRRYSDFHCYYTAGKRILSKENIYVIKDKEAAEFRYAPIFALFMSIFALLDEDVSDTIWFSINFLLLIIAFILLKKLLIPQETLNLKTSLILYALTILGVIRFIFHNFDTGQVNILILASILYGLYLISKGREEVGGAILAFSTMIKYTPLLFIPYFVLRKKLKLALVLIVFIFIYLFLPALFIGFKTNLLYLKNLVLILGKGTIFEQMTILDPKNQSLFSALHRIFTNCILYFYAPPMPFQSLNLSERSINLIFIILSLIMYLVILLRPRKNHLGEKSLWQDNIDYALLLICIVLFNLNAWMHNYILLSPAYFILLYYLIKIGFKDRFVFILLIFSYILNIITSQPILNKTLAYKLHFYSPLTISALVVFLALLKIKGGRLKWTGE